ncbi:predicted protein [Chaetoceros tenuissimus]|uniref:Uncharacterized protein n=1 Tax=Chaetoceros tenuissimus TaxID=426638 RepID=A0AAD3H7J4_9STRA|nr:predicted protein [Chaetoceros tenuissimus]
MKPLFVPEHILNSDKAELYELILKKSGQNNIYSETLREMMQQSPNESHKAGQEGSISTFADRMLNEIAKKRKFDAYGIPERLKS